MSEHDERLRDLWSRLHWLVRVFGWGIITAVMVQLLVWALQRLTP